MSPRDLVLLGSQNATQSKIMSTLISCGKLLQTSTPRLQLASQLGQWDPPLRMNTDSAPDKVAIAHEACRYITTDHLGRFDLRQQIERLI
jgi:hypothetical protein